MLQMTEMETDVQAYVDSGVSEVLIKTEFTRAGCCWRCASRRSRTAGSSFRNRGGDVANLQVTPVSIKLRIY